MRIHMKNKERTTSALMDILFDELDLLVAGKSTPQQAASKAKIANTILSVKRIEVDIARFVADSRMTGSATLESVKLAS
jgi:hypothetical protein